MELRQGGNRGRLILAVITRTRIGLLAAVIVLHCSGGTAATGQEFVPFVIPPKIEPGQHIWAPAGAPITPDSTRLAAAEHFHQDQRVRIWGVNLCFGANFPTHEDAPHVAARLAAAGVNSVRCHHMDSARWPRGIWDAQDGKTIEPKALDRLDFFINELAKRGIWVNINLHVGHSHSRTIGLPEANTSYDKIVGIFTPALIDAQKQYARDLLTHVNPYRKVRYADDPAIAFVEITNEDSFFMWDGDEKLRTLPPYYAEILQGQFNSWLRRKYGSDSTLRAAWAKGVQPLGEDMLQNGTFADWETEGKKPWHWGLEQHEGCQASLSQSPDMPESAVRIEINKVDDTEWHLQLTQGGFAVVSERYYTVSFKAASRKPRTISCGVSQAHSPWGNLGLSRRVELGPDWKTFTFGFVAGADDDNARISFGFGGNETTFQLAGVELRPGGQVGLAEGEALETGKVKLFQENESTPRILDRTVFLAETEKAYFDDMRSYVRNDLGCGALVTGTIVFGPLGLYAQSDMDFIDSHAYWQHPRFPGRPWDSGNWLIEQRPMTDHPEQATLFRIAAERMAGKPFTLSEYNHPAPLDAQAECVPMVASFAAAQDWDGIWLFTYSHATDDWEREAMSGFFDMDTNPAKWGFMRAGTAIFLDGRIPCLRPARTVRVANIARRLPAMAELHGKRDRNMLAVLGDAGRITWEDMLNSRILPDYAGARLPSLDQNAQATELKWSVDNGGRGIYQAIGPQAQVYTGHAGRFEEATRGKIRVASPDFVTLTVTPLDDAAKEILVTACGRCENTGMKFSPDRRTVGRNWGQAPVRIEPVEGRMILPQGKWTCHALAPDGSPRRNVPVAYEDGRGVLTLSPEYGTMWYLLETQTK
mgnify:CR=1 FL=1